MALVLSVEDYTGPQQWRWLLTDQESGRPLADHQVSLDPQADDYVAFTGLYRYQRWNAVPDMRTASEAEIVTRVGAWAGREALGHAVGRAIADAAPVTVRVIVPPEAGFLLGWPLELAHAGGRPLAARGDVTLVYDLRAPLASHGADPESGGARPETRPVRLLAVFSLPTETSVLALRRERYELARLVRRIGTRERRQVEVTFLQYGVTRKRLADVVDSGDGWDVLHLSGHGGAGLFLLETEDGSPDRVSTSDLVAMLRPLRRRVRLAIMSACESAAATTAETLRWVGLTEQAEQLEQQDAAALAAGGQGDQEPEEVMTGIARALVAELGCAVVAMRYPVTDDFAIAFTGHLYERLLGRAQPLGTALARAIPDAAGPHPSAARPAICLATPVLIGQHAADLRLPAPRGRPLLDPAEVRMERFPPERERFVGRAGEMARASAVLAAGSGQTGVLLHGMAGSGKTACALELAYRHQDSFAAVAFWQAPERDDEFGAALASLASALEVQLGGYGFAMADKITTIESLEAFLPRLRALLEASGILLVLDNLETLLTPEDTWRDPRWGPLITALTGHRGESRVILTSRIPPAQVAVPVLVLPVHALSLDESAALARELPGLRALLHADASPLRDADQAVVERDRGLVRRVLHVVQGHPELLEFADAAADDPVRLQAHLAAAESTAASGGQVLGAFFRDGTTSLDAGQLLDTLAAWTASALAALPEPARLMAQFLAFAEDDDRQSGIIDANWEDVWRRLGQPGDPPYPAPLLAALAGAALIQAEPAQHDGDGGEPAVLYRVHPGVAQAIRVTAGPDLRAATDTELAAFWNTVATQARQREGGEAGQVIVRAGLAAAPYLIRLQAWDTAVGLLQEALVRDESPGTVQVILPPLRAIAGAVPGPASLGLLARALMSVDPAQAEQMLRDGLARATARADWPNVAAFASMLVRLLREALRLREALDLAEKQAGYTRQAGFGPWTQLADQARSLEILVRMGEHQQVLAEVPALRAQMQDLPEQPGRNEAVDPWNVRESLLTTGRSAALVARDWQQCLDLNAAVLASMQARQAGAHEIARFQYNDYSPLLRLGRLGDAERLLAGCQQVFEEHGDLAQLGKVLSARADLESQRGNQTAALAFERTAIRYSYATSDPRDIAISHFNLAGYLRNARADPAAQRAHLLAATLIDYLAGMAGEVRTDLVALARDLAGNDGQVLLPGTLAEVITVAEQTEGVRLGDLITALEPDTQAAAAALARILEDASARPAGQDDSIGQHLQEWQPVIAGIVGAAGGDQQAAEALAPFLDQAAQSQDWAALAAVLRRIVDGERDAGLLDGLDEIDTAIAGEILTRLTQPPAETAQDQT